MLGYNVSKIQELLEKMVNSRGEVKSAMQNGWNNMKGVLRTQWIGADEQSFENKLAQRLIELYDNVQDNTFIFVQNVGNLGKSWIEFQKNNIIEGGGANENPVSLQIPDLSKDQLQLDLTKIDLTNATDLGLKEGKASAERITSAVQDYVKEVYTKTEQAYSNMDSTAAFLGDEQKTQINKYLSDMGTALAKVTSCVKDLNDAMTQLVANYTLQQQNIVESSSKKVDNLVDNEGSMMNF